MNFDLSELSAGEDPLPALAAETREAIAAKLARAGALLARMQIAELDRGFAEAEFWAIVGELAADNFELRRINAEMGTR
jgi:hypothetical protein